VSAAQVQGGSLTGAQVEDGSLTGADINQASLTAVRAANVSGFLVKGDGSCSPQVPFPAGVSAEHGVSGVCSLNFPDSVAECAATVSVGGSLLIAEERSAQTSREAKAPNQIRVITYQESARQDLPFDLILVC
jgi:uncharacterized protein YjbI with pentapeptide repeats